jgi:hypothetical protein
LKSCGGGVRFPISRSKYCGSPFMQQPATGMGFVMFWEGKSSCGGLLLEGLSMLYRTRSCVACDFVYFLIFNLVMFTCVVVAQTTKFNLQTEKRH